MSKHTLASITRMAGGKPGREESLLVAAELRTPKGALAGVTLDPAYGKIPALWLRVAPTHVDAMRKLVDAQLHPSTGKAVWKWNDRRQGWWAYSSAHTLAWLTSLGLDTGMSAPTPTKASTPKTATPAKGKSKPKGKTATRTQASTPAPKPAGTTLADLSVAELRKRIDTRMADIALLMDELQSRTSK